MPRDLVPTPYRPFLYVPDGWDATWRAAKAACPGAPARVLIIGDSIAAGQSCSTFAKPFPEILAATLAPQLGGRYADYYPSTLHPQFGTPAGTPWTDALNSICNFSTANWLGWHTPQYHSTTSSVVYQTFTSPYACTQIDIFYVDSYPGTWQYRVDGGSWNTVTEASASSTAANTSVKKISLTGLSNTTHTVDFGNQSANAAWMLMGCACYSGQAGGLGVARFTVTGASIEDLQQGGAMPADRFALYSNKSPQNDTTNPGTGSFAPFPLAPHLVIYEWLINSANNTQPSADTRDGTFKLLSAIRRAQPDASVLFLVPNYPFNPYSDVTNNLSGNQAAYNQYVQELYHTAQVHGCAVANFHQKWGSTPFAKGFMPNNNVHPNDAGHADIASTLLTIL